MTGNKKLFLLTGTLCGFFLFISHPACLFGQTKAQIDLIEKQRKRALSFQNKHQWGRACVVYQKILHHQSDFPQIRSEYLHCLRRYYQVRRHLDPSFRKEVLSLRYSESMKFYGFILNLLLENSLDSEQITPELMFQRGLEELDYALASPAFVRAHLPKTITEADIAAFRVDLLMTDWGANDPLYTPQDAANMVRRVAKAALRKLRLKMTVTVMEFTCGSCYAVDDYTMYLTPGELRNLCRSLKGQVDSSVDFYFREEAVGYLKITEFNETTVGEVDQALMMLAKMEAKALILDLRGNSGGLVDSAIEIARRFLPSGVIVITQAPKSKTPVTFQSRNPDAVTLPLVVLVDSDTASAAEILAGALKENGRARLVGETTYGKGCLQNLYQFAAKNRKGYPGGLRLTVARFFSPSGTPYTGKGVTPHVSVAGPPGPISLSSADRQLNSAVAEIQQLAPQPQ